MFDIHAHLQFPDYDADRDEVIARARAAGVERMIIVGTDIGTSRAAVELAERYDFLSAAVGIHPHEYDEERCPIEDLRAETESLKELARHPKAVAIGECGLDYFSRDPQRRITDSRKAIQKEGFSMQMEIAREAGLPMIIHTRPSAGSMDAYEDLYDMLSDPDIARSASKFVLHCYQGDTDVTERFLGLSRVYFSFAGNVTYPVKKVLVGTKNDIVKTVGFVPLERMFVETDCPYLPPQEKRGARNEPSYVVLTAARVSAFKGVDVHMLERTLRSNFSEVFSDGDISS